MIRLPPRQLGAAVGLVAISALLFLAGHGGRRTAEPPVLPPGPTLQRALPAGGEHRFNLPLAAGDAVELHAEQQGVDVVLRLLDPGRRPVAIVDGPSRRLGTEILLAVAPAAGTYQVEVSPLPGEPAGRYALRLAPPRPASRRFRERSAAAASLAGGADEAGASRALATARRTGDGVLAAEAWEQLALHAAAAGDWTGAERRWAAAATLWQRLGQPWREALALPELAFARRRTGDFAGAEAAYRRALPVRRAAADREGQAAILQNLADLHQLRGEVEPALAGYRQARRLWRDLGENEREAQVLQSLGVLLQTLGEDRRARACYRAAAERFARADDPRRNAESLSRLGVLEHRAGRPRAAEALYRHALVLHRRGADRPGEAATLANLALLDRDRGRYAQSGRRYLAALATLRELGNRPWQAEVLLHLGHLEELRGDAAAAGVHHREALALFEELGMRRRSVAARVGVARAADRGGDSTTALAEAARAAAAAEGLRTAPADPALRALYFATVQEAFDLQVHLLSAAGDARGAFEAADRARARALLDLVAGTSSEGEAESLLPVRRSPGPAVAPGGPGAPAAASSGTSSPGAGSPGAPVLPLPEIRRRLLPDGTALLAYHLGSRESHLWWIDGERLEQHPLPPAERLEALAREAHRLLAVSHRREARDLLARTLCEASRALLGPVAPRLEGQRLWVVADGALALLPFAALPHPAAADCTLAAPLIAAHEIAAVPSASAAAALVARRQRPPAERLLAVLAVPDALDGLPALPHARREAVAVRARAAALRPAPAVRLAIGAGPAARLARGGGLGGYRILHFASHAVADPLDAARSGVVVGSGPGAAPVWLRSAEVRRLDLRADLVVLSACRTALGRELRGEGLLGLAHAFFDAGASSLAVGLWDLQDRSAAQLVDRFYRALLERGRPPAAALRDAQLELAGDARWSAPVHWAGLLVQGDGWSDPLRSQPRKEIR